jgi:hypothetical protein
VFPAIKAERQEEDKVSACILTRIKGPYFLRSGRNKIQFSAGDTEKYIVFCRRGRKKGPCFLQERQE